MRERGKGRVWFAYWLLRMHQDEGRRRTRSGGGVKSMRVDEAAFVWVLGTCMTLMIHECGGLGDRAVICTCLKGPCCLLFVVSVSVSVFRPGLDTSFCSWIRYNMFLISPIFP